jgi:hypothetical protein
MDEYRFSHFDREVAVGDVAFHGGPAPGDTLPDFDLATTSGGRLRRADLEGRPTLVTFASVTCPMTASAAPILKKLYEEFSGRVAFVTVYVREAHPGERYPQPEDDERKAEHAREYEARDEIPWRVAVDDIEGTFHQAMDGHTNAAWFVDADGRVAFRSLWSNDERALRRGFAVVLGEAEGGAMEREARVLPLLRGLGVMDEVLEAAGPTARIDVKRAALPVYAFARLARQFRPLPPLGRSIAAGATTLAAALLVVRGLVRLFRRPDSRIEVEPTRRPDVMDERMGAQARHALSPEVADRIRRRGRPVERYVIERALR